MTSLLKGSLSGNLFKTTFFRPMNGLHYRFDVLCGLWACARFKSFFMFLYFNKKKCANGSTNLVFRQLTKCDFNEARILVDFFFNYMHIILSTNKKNSLSMCIASRCHFGKRQKENKME